MPSGTPGPLGRSEAGVRRIRALAALIVLAVTVPGAPGAAAGAGDRQVVWVALEGAGQVVKVDITDGRVLRRFDTPGGPHNITVAPDGTVVVALWDTDEIAIVRDGDVALVELGGAPHDVKIARNLAVVANRGSERIQLVKLDGTLDRKSVV